MKLPRACARERVSAPTFPQKEHHHRRSHFILKSLWRETIKSRNMFYFMKEEKEEEDEEGKKKG